MFRDDVALLTVHRAGGRGRAGGPHGPVAESVDVLWVGFQRGLGDLLLAANLLDALAELQGLDPDERRAHDAEHGADARDVEGPVEVKGRVGVQDQVAVWLVKRHQVPFVGAVQSKRAHQKQNDCQHIADSWKSDIKIEK